MLRFVRIEYAGAPVRHNRIAGLTLAGVGAGTTINYVQVRQTLDDCFSFQGGTVNAKHLVCQRGQGDGFHLHHGHRGQLQFLILQQSTAATGEIDGFELGKRGQRGIRAPVRDRTDDVQRDDVRPPGGRAG